ncbi:MAG: hypothetical protein ACJAR9_000005 [Celeribacter sp.]|jgi:hypothetical protein
MTTRFTNLKKVPAQPAVRLLAMANTKLETKLTTPANADIETVMAELDAAGAVIDMLRLMAVALPARERVWWACLAGRDLVAPDADVVPAPLLAAEAWVRKPSDQTRDAARATVEVADIDDDTVYCANAVVFCDDTLGTGDLAQHAAPPGASQTCAFGMNVTAMALGDDIIETAQVLIDRAVDIAQGGNGQLTRTAPPPTQIEDTAQ